MSIGWTRTLLGWLSWRLRLRRRGRCVDSFANEVNTLRLLSCNRGASRLAFFWQLNISSKRVFRSVDSSAKQKTTTLLISLTVPSKTYTAVLEGRMAKASKSGEVVAKIRPDMQNRPRQVNFRYRNHVGGKLIDTEGHRVGA